MNNSDTWRGCMIRARLVGLLFSSFLLLPSAFATTWQSDGTATSVQYLNDNLAQDGDTITMPVGTFSWTQGVTITKGITLQGLTTTDPVNRTAEDQTIVLDNVARGAGMPIIMIQSVAGKSFRLSGLTFSVGSVTISNSNGAIKLYGDSQTVRIDHCHFNNLAYQSICIKALDSVYGVIDHNVFDSISSSGYSIVPSNGGLNGNPAWAAPAGWGSSQFMFIEDNCFNNYNYVSREYAMGTDDDHGAKWVWRHNHCYDIELQTHGTECCLYRGHRAVEVYNNDFHFTLNRAGAIGIRCGGLVTHDNTFFGIQPNHGAIIQAYRMFFKFPGPFGGSSGDNPWDLNDPALYESGAVTNGSGTTLVDTTKNWTTNQWASYAVKRPSDGGFSLILSNTSNTLNVFYYSDSGGSPIWTA